LRAFLLYQQPLPDRLYQTQSPRGRLQAEFLAQHLAAEFELAQGLFAPPGVERAGLLVCGGGPAFVPRRRRSFSPVAPDGRDK